MDSNIIEVKKEKVGIISIGVTWVEGRCLYKLNTKFSKFFYGICHFSNSIAMITPVDFERPLMIATINISLTEEYCERAYSCLDFGCPLNRFNKDIFINEFEDCGGMSLGLPADLGTKPLWWSDLRDRWKEFVIRPNGGILRFDSKKFGSDEV